MQIKVLKSKNGYRLLQYPSGTYGVEYSDASYGAGMKYTDSKTDAIKFFKKVSGDTSSVSVSRICKQSQKQEQLNKKSRMIKDADKLKLGEVTCVIRNKYTGVVRYAKGSVSLVPYKKGATKELKQRYGKNLVYVLYRDYEEIIGYLQ